MSIHFELLIPQLTVHAHLICTFFLIFTPFVWGGKMSESRVKFTHCIVFSSNLMISPSIWNIIKPFNSVYFPHFVVTNIKCVSSLAKICSIFSTIQIESVAPLSPPHSGATVYVARVALVGLSHAMAAPVPPLVKWDLRVLFAPHV